MAADALSNLLKTVRLTGATFFDIAAQDSWAVGSPAPASILPRILPGADHLIAYHVVTAGRCFARTIGGETIALEAGEVVVFTQGDAHIMSSSPGMSASPPTADVLEIAFAGQMPFHINYANGGPGSTNLPYFVFQRSIGGGWQFGQASSYSIVVVVASIVIATIALRVLSGLLKGEEIA